MTMIEHLLAPDLISALTATVLVRAAAILAIAFLVTRALQRAAASTRHAIWSAALTSVLLLPLAAAVLPRWNLPGAGGPLPVSALPPRLTQNLSTMAEGPAASAHAVHGPVLPPATDPRRGEPSRVVIALALLWAAGACIGLARIAVCVAGVVRLRRSSEDAGDAVEQLAREARLALGIRRHVDVRVTGLLEVPVNCGAMRPVVLLPASSREWSRERTRVVLLHELAHVRRWDYLSLIATRLAQAIYWINPLVWVAARHAEMDLERACDDEVLRAGTASIEYAEHLHAIAARLAGARVTAGALAMARPSTLRERVSAILSRTANRAPLGPRAAAGAAFVMAFVALPLAGVRLMGEGREAAEQRGALLSLTLDDPQWRTRAAFALGTRHSRDAVPALEEHLRDADPAVRGMAAWALGEIGLARSLGPLTAALGDSDPHVREMTVLALGALGDRRAVAALAPMVHDTFAGVRSVLTRALEHIGGEEAGDVLAQLMLHDADHHTRVMAGYSARLVLGGGGIGPHVAALRDTSDEIRAMAARNLGELKDPAAVKWLTKAIELDGEPRVRGTAAWALGQIAGDEAVEGLAVAMRDRSWHVRVAAADALGRTGGSRVADLLIAATRDPVHQVRLTAVEALEARAR